MKLVAFLKTAIGGIVLLAFLATVILAFIGLFLPEESSVGLEEPGINLAVLLSLPEDVPTETVERVGRSTGRPHILELNAEIEDAQRSTMLCHYGNIAYRASGAVTIDPQSGRISGDEESEQFWGREYRAGWTPKV